ncbi:MAG: DUF177 domain-containing protein [Chloroflexi bacterium]|nr:DUF177 domain-containing protein [Chloroflexota bacterium]
MLFNVSGLLREPVGSTRDYILEPEPPVHRGRVELIRTPGGVLVRCEADVVLDGVCSRCLAAFGYHEAISFEEIFVQQVDVVSGHKLAPPEDPDSFLISQAHTIDITEAVRQYSEAAAEMQPLCRPDCPGICPECGQDLNIAGCSCEQQPVDHRWAALAGLKQASNG